MITLYGIKNCDTVRKARNWLAQADIPYRFHDFREDGVEEKTLRQWADRVGWETLLNRKSTTWRKLPASARESMDVGSAVHWMAKEPTLIKRPVLVQARQVLVGFRADEYQKQLSG